MMIVLYRVVSCDRSDSGDGNVYIWRLYKLYSKVSFRLPFDNSSVASIQFLRLTPHGTRPLGMIYSLVFPRFILQTFF